MSYKDNESPVSYEENTHYAPFIRKPRHTATKKHVTPGEAKLLRSLRKEKRDPHELTEAERWLDEDYPRRVKVMEERYKNWTPNRPIKTCTVCGIRFKCSANNQLRCSPECAKVAKARTMKPYNAQYYRNSRKQDIIMRDMINA